MHSPTSAEDMLRPVLQDQAVRKLNLRRKSFVYKVGTPATELYAVESGLIGLGRTAADPAHGVIFGVVGSGGLFGFHTLSGASGQTADALALQDSVVLCIPKEVIARVCERQPHISWLLLQHAVMENDRLSARIQHSCHYEIRDRILYSLRELVERNGADKNGDTVRLSQADLAAIVGATRETTSTVLNQLAREGILELGHRQILVRDWSGFETGPLFAHAATSCA